MLKIAFKKQLFVLMLLSFVLLIATFVFIPYSFENIAKALTGNYSKTTGATLDFNDWNNLDNDFLDKNSITGDSMSGPLLLPADPTSNLQAATKQYVDTAIVLGGSGDIYTNWGQSSCPLGNLVYNGYAFSQMWDKDYGSNEVLCIKSGEPGSLSVNQVDRLSPIATGQSGYIPAGIASEKIVKCSVCSVPQSSCFVEYGGDTCNPGVGFNVAYSGFVMGGSEGNYYASNNKNQIERKCVNSSFDGSLARGAWGGIFYGSVLYNNFGLSGQFSTDDNYIKCAICCN